MTATKESTYLLEHSDVDRASVSDVSGRADGVPNQRPEARRSEHHECGASRLTSDRFIARDRAYVFGVMILTLAFGLAVATSLERVL